MRKGKGILTEIQGKKGIVITSKGEFKKVKIPEGADVGKEIEFSKGPSYLPLVAGFILIIFFSFSLMNNTSPVTAAYMTLDFNSGIEIGLDQELNVVSVKSLDEKDSEFIESLSLIGTPINQAVEEIVDEAIKSNIITNRQEAEVEMFATVTINEIAVNEETMEGLMFDNIGKQHIKSDIIIQTASQEDLNNAREQKITPAKYIMLQKIEEKGLVLDQDKDELLKFSVQELARIIREMDVMEKNPKVELTENKAENGEVKILVNEQENVNDIDVIDRKNNKLPSRHIKTTPFRYLKKDERQEKAQELSSRQLKKGDNQSQKDKMKNHNKNNSKFRRTMENIDEHKMLYERKKFNKHSSEAGFS